PAQHTSDRPRRARPRRGVSACPLPRGYCHASRVRMGGTLGREGLEASPGERRRRDTTMIATAADTKLAVDGGTPVRQEPLRAEYPGASVIGDEERREVLEVLDRRTLFRYYGPQQPD